MKEVVYSLVKGIIRDINTCTDEIFAEKTMGDGFLIIPEDKTVVSPVNGVVKSVFPTKHAITILTDKGNEILIHVGIDTVELEGKYFEQMVQNESYVKVGQPLLKADFDKITEQGYDVSVLVIVLSNVQMRKENLNKEVDGCVPVLTLSDEKN